MSSTYPKTGSTLQSNISTGLSTQIVVKVGSDTVGALQQLEVRQNRPLARLVELGTDGVLEIVPQQKTDVSLTVRRIVFDRLRITEAFERGYINIKAQRLPFDILVIDQSGGDGENAITHHYINCWFQDISTPYSAENYIITESATIWAEDVSSRLGSNSNVAQGGARDMTPQIEPIERETDLGGRRGTLDAPGLITAAFSS
jgi:hypothetical protein